MPLGSGISQATADTRYVNVSGGDTINDYLIVNPTLQVGTYPGVGSSLVINGSAGSTGGIYYRRDGINSWTLYDGNSSNMFFRDMVNNRHFLIFIPGTYDYWCY